MIAGGGPFRHDPAAPGSPGFCPRCPDVSLSPRAQGIIELAVCRSCRGSWVGKQRVADLLASGVRVDVCPRHGIWFDTDELPRFLAYILAMGGPV